MLNINAIYEHPALWYVYDIYLPLPSSNSVWVFNIIL